jgi:RNA-directed DNA polymerase
MSDISILLDAVCAPQNISLAWSRFARCRGLWAPGVPMTRVAAAPLRPVLSLVDELRSGCYRPQAAYRLPIRKVDGGIRELHVFMLRDRVAQRALLQVLQPRAEPAMSPASFGFRPGRSVAQALQAVREGLDTGLSWIGDADVERCFDRMTHRHALQAVERVLGSASAELVARWMGWPGCPRPEDRGLPQGSVLAPWLCNLYLAPLDARVRAQGYGWVRYADDFVVLAPTRHAAARGLALCQHVLAGLSLNLQPMKTSVRHAVEPFRFLGQWLAPTARLPAPAM